MSYVKYLAALALMISSTNVLAEDEDESFVGFDSIVNELKASSEDPMPVANSDWEEVALHAGVGIVTSFIDVQSPGGDSGAGVMKGLEAHFGANLFTRVARAEILFRNFAPESLSSTVNADLREFELRLVYLPVLQDKLRMRLGAGFSARYMNVNDRRGEHTTSTPATSLMLGFERKISSTMTVGPDLSYRSAMISDTFDRMSWDASLNLNATF